MTQGRKPTVREPLPVHGPSLVLSPSMKTQPYAPIATECVRRVAWLREAREGIDLYFRLCEPGRVTVFEAGPHATRLNQEFDSDDPQRARDMSLTIHRGAFVLPANLRIPAPALAHVVGDPSGSTGFWIAAEEEGFELWNEVCLRRQTVEADARIRAQTSLFPGRE